MPAPKKKILVVEDSLAMRMAYKMMLSKLGYDVVDAGDGNLALDVLLKNLDTRLLICDVNMPQMNGFEFLELVRRSPQFSRIPVVMASSEATPENLQRGVKLGIKAWIVKPLTLEQIKEAVFNAIGPAFD
jgi:CheY-like chemotaxis protein